MLRLLTLGRLAVEPASELGDGGGPRPRRLALLAILAAAGPQGISRDRVLAILWPESDEERGRHALSQTLYSLRRDLGRDVVVGSTELRLDPNQMRSDLEDLKEAIAGKRWEQASAVYAGPFAEGFHLSDGPGFDQWLEGERHRIAAAALPAIETAAVEAQSTGNLAQARQCWSRLVQADPLSGRYASGLMAALAALGDNAAALAHARVYTETVRRELDTEPDPAVRQLVATLRTGRTARSVPAPTKPDGTVEAEAPPGPVTLVRAPSQSRRLARGVLGLLLLAATAIALWRMRQPAAGPARPVLAVGTLRDLATPDTVPLGGVISDMLSTNLARLTDLEVIASTRILQLLPTNPDSSGRARLAAARQAGASEILEGEISSTGSGLRLDLRRVDLATGRVRRGYVVMAPDRFALIDSATAAVARDMAISIPALSVAEITTTSPIAYRLYEEGLRAFYQVDRHAAARLFKAALEEDSTFALAAYYAWRTADDSTAETFRRLALQLTDRAPERERLLMRVQISANDPAVRAAAESLAVRYPTDPEALIRSAGVFTSVMGSVDWTAGVLERAIALDSAPASSPHRDLRLADAFQTLVDLYAIHDSIAAVERSLRRWTTFQPASPVPWSRLAMHYEVLGRPEEAERAYVRHNSLSLAPPDPLIGGIWRGIHRGQPEFIRDVCSSPIHQDDPVRWGPRRWYCTLGYRHLGQLRTALATVRAELPPPIVSQSPPTRDRINEAILDFEMGRPLLAGRSYQELAKASTPWPGEAARNEAWMLTLSATAYVAAGDTVRARALVDSIEVAGAGSLYARDPRLHHFVRGQLLAVQNRHADALEQFRLAAFSWPLGYTRVNLEYGRSALALGRPRQAIYPLQAALRGGIEGPQLYVTRTDLHEMLARVFDAAGMPDSAAPHYRYVVRMWAGADPPWRARQQQAAAWLAARGRPR